MWCIELQIFKLCQETKFIFDKDIEKIATHGEKAEVPALTGWRYELFGKDAINLVDGKLALVIHGQDLEAVEFGEK